MTTQDTLSAYRSGLISGDRGSSNEAYSDWQLNAISGRDQTPLQPEAGVYDYLPENNLLNAGGDYYSDRTPRGSYSDDSSIAPPADYSRWVGPRPQGDISLLPDYSDYAKLVSLNNDESDRMGFWEGIWDRESLPFIGGILEGIDTGSAALTANKLSKGQDVSDKELLNFNLWHQDMYRKSDAKRTGQIGMILGSSVAMGVEMGLTSGLAGAGIAGLIGKKGMAKLAQEVGEDVTGRYASIAIRKQIYAGTRDFVKDSLGKELGEKWLMRQAGRFAGAATDMSLTAAVTLAGKEAVTLGGTAMFGDMATTKGAAERMIRNPEMSNLEALMWDAGDMFIEYSSEASGPYLGKLMGKVAKRTPILGQHLAKVQKEVTENAFEQGYKGGKRATAIGAARKAAAGADDWVQGDSVSSAAYTGASAAPYNEMLEIIMPRTGRAINQFLLSRVDRLSAEGASEAATKLLSEGRRVAGTGMLLASYMSKHNVNMDVAVNRLRQMGQNGVIEEWGEERFGGWYRGIMGVGEEMEDANDGEGIGLLHGNLDIGEAWRQMHGTLDQNLTEIMAFAVMPVTMGAFRNAISSKWLGGNPDVYLKGQQHLNNLFNPQGGHDAKNAPRVIADRETSSLVDAVQAEAELGREGHGQVVGFFAKILDAVGGAGRGNLDPMLREAGMRSSARFVSIYNVSYDQTKSYLEAENELKPEGEKLSSAAIEKLAQDTARGYVHNSIAQAAGFIRLAAKSTRINEKGEQEGGWTEAEEKEIVKFITETVGKDAKMEITQTEDGIHIQVNGEPFDVAGAVAEKWATDQNLTFAVSVMDLEKRKSRLIEAGDLQMYETMNLEQQAKVRMQAGFNPRIAHDAGMGGQDGALSDLQTVVADHNARALLLQDATRSDIRVGDLVEATEMNAPSGGEQIVIPENAMVKKIDQQNDGQTIYTVDVNGKEATFSTGDYTVERIKIEEIVDVGNEVIYGTIAQLEEKLGYGIKENAVGFRFRTTDKEDAKLNGEPILSVSRNAQISHDGKKLFLNQKATGVDVVEDLIEGSHKRVRTAMARNAGETGNIDTMELDAFEDNIVDTIGASAATIRNALQERLRQVEAGIATKDVDSAIPEHIAHIANDEQALKVAIAEMSTIVKMVKADPKSDSEDAHGRWEVFHKYWVLNENQMGESTLIGQRRNNSIGAVSEIVSRNTLGDVTSNGMSTMTRGLLSDIGSRTSRYGWAFSVLPTIENMYADTDAESTRSLYQEHMTGIVGLNVSEAVVGMKPKLSGKQKDTRMPIAKQATRSMPSGKVPLNTDEEASKRWEKGAIETAIKVQHKAFKGRPANNSRKVPEVVFRALAKLYMSKDADGVPRFGEKKLDLFVKEGRALAKESGGVGFGVQMQSLAVTEFLEKVERGEINDVLREVKTAEVAASKRKVNRDKSIVGLRRNLLKETGHTKVMEASDTGVTWVAAAQKKDYTKEEIDELVAKTTISKKDNLITDKKVIEDNGLLPVGTKLNVLWKKKRTESTNTAEAVAGYTVHKTSRKIDGKTVHGEEFRMVTVNPASKSQEGYNLLKTHELGPNLFLREIVKSKAGFFNKDTFKGFDGEEGQAKGSMVKDAPPAAESGVEDDPVFNQLKNRGLVGESDVDGVVPISKETKDIVAAKLDIGNHKKRGNIKGKLPGKGDENSSSIGIANKNYEVVFNKEQAAGLQETFSNMMTTLRPMIEALIENKTEINNAPPELQVQLYDDMMAKIRVSYNMKGEHREQIFVLAEQLVRSYLLDADVATKALRASKQYEGKEQGYDYIGTDSEGYWVRGTTTGKVQPIPLSVGTIGDLEGFGEWIYYSKFGAGYYIEEATMRLEAKRDEAQEKFEAESAKGSPASVQMKAWKAAQDAAEAVEDAAVSEEDAEGEIFSELYEDGAAAQYRATDKAVKDLMTDSLMDNFIRRYRWSGMEIDLKNMRVSLSNAPFPKENIVNFFSSEEGALLMEKVLFNKETYDNFAARNPKTRLAEDQKRQTGSKIHASFYGTSYDDAKNLVSRAQSVPIITVIGGRIYKGKFTSTKLNPLLSKHVIGNNLASIMLQAVKDLTFKQYEKDAEGFYVEVNNEFVEKEGVTLYDMLEQSGSSGYIKYLKDIDEITASDRAIHTENVYRKYASKELKEEKGISSGPWPKEETNKRIVAVKARTEAFINDMFPEKTSLTPKEKADLGVEEFLEQFSQLLGLDKDSLIEFELSDPVRHREMMKALLFTTHQKIDFFRRSFLDMDNSRDFKNKYRDSNDQIKVLRPYKDLQNNFFGEGALNVGYIMGLAESEIKRNSEVAKAGAKEDVDMRGNSSFMYPSTRGDTMTASRMLMDMREMYIEADGKAEDFAMYGGSSRDVNGYRENDLYAKDFDKISGEFFNDVNAEGKYWFMGLPVGEKKLVPMYRVIRHSIAKFAGPTGGAYGKAFNKIIKSYDNMPDKERAEAVKKLKELYLLPENFEDYLKSFGKDEDLEYHANFSLHRLELDAMIYGAAMDYKDHTSHFKYTSQSGTPSIRGIPNIEDGLADTSKYLVINIPKDFTGKEIAGYSDGKINALTSTMLKISASFGSKIKDLPVQLKMCMSGIETREGVRHRVNIKGLVNLAHKDATDSLTSQVADILDKYNEGVQNDPLRTIDYFGDTDASKELNTKGRVVNLIRKTSDGYEVDPAVARMLLNHELDKKLVTLNNRNTGIINEQDYNPLPQKRKMLKQYLANIAQLDGKNEIVGYVNKQIQMNADRILAQGNLIDEIILRLYEYNPDIAELLSSGVSPNNPVIYSIVQEMISGAVISGTRATHNGKLTSDAPLGSGKLNVARVIDIPGVGKRVMPQEVSVSGLGLRDEQPFATRPDAEKWITDNKYAVPEAFPRDESGMPDYDSTDLYDLMIEERVMENGSTSFFVKGEPSSGRRNPTTHFSSNTYGTQRASIAAQITVERSDGTKVKTAPTSYIARLAEMVLRGSDYDGDHTHVHVFARNSRRQVVFYTSKREDQLLAFAKKHEYSKESDNLIEGFEGETLTPQQAFDSVADSLANKVLMKEGEINRDVELSGRIQNALVNPGRWVDLADTVKNLPGRSKVLELSEINGQTPINTASTYLYHAIRSQITGTQKVGHAIKSSMNMLYALQDWNAAAPFMPLLKEDSLNLSSEGSHGAPMPFDLIVKRAATDEASIRHASRAVMRANFDLSNAVLDDKGQDQCIALGFDVASLVTFLMVHNPTLGRNAEGKLASDKQIDKNIDNYMKQIVGFLNTSAMVQYRKELIATEGIMADGETMHRYKSEDGTKVYVASTVKAILVKLNEGKTKENRITHSDLTKAGLLSTSHKKEKVAIFKTELAISEGEVAGTRSEAYAALEFLENCTNLGRELSTAGRIQEFDSTRIKNPAQLKSTIEAKDEILTAPNMKDENEDKKESSYPFYLLADNPYYKKALVVMDLYDKLIGDNEIYYNENTLTVVKHAYGREFEFMTGTEQNNAIKKIFTVGVKLEAAKKFGIMRENESIKTAELYEEVLEIVKNNIDVRSSVLIGVTTLSGQYTQAPEDGVNYGVVGLIRAALASISDSDIEQLKDASARIGKLEDIGTGMIKDGNDLLLAMLVLAESTAPISTAYRSGSLMGVYHAKFIGEVLEPIHQTFLKNFRKEGKYDGSSENLAYIMMNTANSIKSRKKSALERANVDTPKGGDRLASHKTEEHLTTVAQAIISSVEKRFVDYRAHELAKAYGAEFVNRPSKKISGHIYAVLPRTGEDVDNTERARKTPGFGNKYYYRTGKARLENMQQHLDQIAKVVAESVAKGLHVYFNKYDIAGLGMDYQYYFQGKLYEEMKKAGFTEFSEENNRTKLARLTAEGDGALMKIPEPRQRSSKETMDAFANMLFIPGSESTPSQEKFGSTFTTHTAHAGKVSAEFTVMHANGNKYYFEKDSAILAAKADGEAVIPDETLLENVKGARRVLGATHSLAMGIRNSAHDVYGDEQSQERPSFSIGIPVWDNRAHDVSGVIDAFAEIGYEVEQAEHDDYVDTLTKKLGLNIDSGTNAFVAAAKVTAYNMMRSGRMKTMFSRNARGERSNPEMLMSTMLSDAFLGKLQNWEMTATQEQLDAVDLFAYSIKNGSGRFLDIVYTGAIYRAEQWNLKKYAEDKRKAVEMQELYLPQSMDTPEDERLGTLEGINTDTEAMRMRILSVLNEKPAPSTGMATKMRLLAAGFPVADKISSRKLGGHQNEIVAFVAGGYTLLDIYTDGIHHVITANRHDLKELFSIDDAQAGKIMDWAWNAKMTTVLTEGSHGRIQELVLGYAAIRRKTYVNQCCMPSGSADVSAMKDAEKWGRDFIAVSKILRDGPDAAAQKEADSLIARLPKYHQHMAKLILGTDVGQMADTEGRVYEHREDVSSASIGIGLDLLHQLPMHVAGGSDALMAAYKGIVKTTDADTVHARGLMTKLLVALGSENFTKPRKVYPGEGSMQMGDYDPKKFYVYSKGKLSQGFDTKKEMKAFYKVAKGRHYYVSEEERAVSYKVRMALQAISDAVSVTGKTTITQESRDAHIYTGHTHTDRNIKDKIAEAKEIADKMYSSSRTIGGTQNPLYGGQVTAHQLNMIHYLVAEGKLTRPSAVAILDRLAKKVEVDALLPATPGHITRKRREATAGRPEAEFKHPWEAISQMQASHLIYEGLVGIGKDNPSRIFQERRVERLTDEGALKKTDLEAYWSDYIYNTKEGRRRQKEWNEKMAVLYANHVKGTPQEDRMSFSEFKDFKGGYHGSAKDAVKLLADAGYKHAVTAGEIMDEYEALRGTPNKRTKFGEVTESSQDLVDMGAEAYRFIRNKSNDLMRDAGISKEWIHSFSDSDGGTFVAHNWKIETEEDGKALKLLAGRKGRYKEGTRVTEKRSLSTLKDAAEYGLVSRSPLFDETFNGYLKETLSVRKNIMSLATGGMAQDSNLQPLWMMRFTEEVDDSLIDKIIPGALNDNVVRHMLASLSMYVNYKRAGNGEKTFNIDLSKPAKQEYNRLIDLIEADGLHKYGFSNVKLKDSPYGSISKYYVQSDTNAEKILKHIVALPVASHIDAEGNLQQSNWVKIIDSVNNWGKDIGIATTASINIDENGSLGFNFGVLGARLSLPYAKFKPNKFRFNIPFSLFHAFSLIESFRSFMGVTFRDPFWISNGSKYIRTLNNQKAFLTDNPELMERYVEAGLTVSFNTPDVDFGLVSRQIDYLKENSSGLMAGWMERWNKDRRETRKWLWQTVHPAMKIACFEVATQDIAKKNPNLSTKFIDQSVARMVNNAFGGQRWEEYIWANPHRRHATTMLAFATDWCVDEKTRAMTKDGFKYYHELNVGDEIMGFDPETKQIKWMRLEDKYQRDDYDGDMINIKNYNKNIMMTPDHTCYVVHDKSRKPLILKAEELNTRHLIQRCAPMVLSNKETVDDLFVKIVGWMITDGSYAHTAWRTLKDGTRKRTRFGRISQNKSRGIEELDTLGLKHYVVAKEKGCHDEFVCNRDINVYTVSVGHINRMKSFGIVGKKLSWKFLSILSERQLRVLKNTMHLADGTGQKRFCGTEESIFNMTLIQTMLGEPTTFYQQEENCWRTRTISSEYISCAGSHNRSKVHYDGTIWCPSVESGFWLAEKDGALFITGNSLSAANISGVTALPGIRDLLDIQTNKIEKEWMMKRYWPGMAVIVMTAWPMTIQLVSVAISRLVSGDLVPDPDDPDPDDDEGAEPRGAPLMSFNNEKGKNGFFGVGASVDVTYWANLMQKAMGQGGMIDGRHYYMRWAKQATEVFEGWLGNPLRTAMGKASISVKLVTEQFFGQVNLPGSKKYPPLGFEGEDFVKGFVQGEEGFWDSRIGYIARKFIPMTIPVDGRPSMPVFSFAPITKGRSSGALQMEMEDAIKAAVSKEGYTAGKKYRDVRLNIKETVRDTFEQALYNKYDAPRMLGAATSRVSYDYYDDLFRAIKKDDMHAAGVAADALLRLGKTYKNIMSSAMSRYGTDLAHLPPEVTTKIQEILESRRK